MAATLSRLGGILERAIENITAHDRYQESLGKEQTLLVPNVANVLLFAYEQLRNASENIEDQLLLQRAILRFYKRNLSFTSKHKPRGLGKELVIELTQAEYLQNDSVPLSTIQTLDELIGECYEAYRQIARQHTDVTPQLAEKWLLELLSVKSEQLFNDPIRVTTFAYFAHAYFTEHIEYDKIFERGESLSDDDYPTLLYIAIHKALLKSDDANARTALRQLHSFSLTDTDQLVAFNKKYDHLAGLDATVKLARFITKNGAPLRIIRSTFFESQISPRSLQSMPTTIRVVDAQIDTEYRKVKRNVNRGVIKSIAFLLITKALIGVSIEVPYDLLVHGMIIVLPLVINLLFPSVFIAITGLTLRLPGPVNKKALLDHIQSMLYTDTSRYSLALKYTESVGGAYVFNVIYIMLFSAIFYQVTTWLAAIGFNVVQGVIFIIFLSTASFLGYRLTLQIKELELVNTHQGIFALVRDFIYAPFIFLGKRISYRFGQLNIIAQILDLMVDLPLKTTVKLVRQWMIFLNNKKDELL